MDPAFTPPSSKTSTPLRPQTSQDTVASPTTERAPHPLRTNNTSAGVTGMTAGEDMEGDSTASELEDAGAIELSGDEMDVELEQAIEASNREAGLVEDEDEEEMEEDEGAGAGEGAEVGGSKGKGKGKAKATKRKPKQKTEARKRPAGGKKAKENELYESDIVQRWNIEIGDIIAERRKPAAPAPASAQPTTAPTAPADPVEA